MLIRMFEYDSQIAMDDGEYKDGVLNVTFPNAAVLFLRHTDALAASGDISEYTKCTRLDMTKKVVNNLTEKYQQVREGVVKIMGGRVLDYEAKDILRTGIQEGMKQGREQGEIAGVLKILVDLVHKGILSAADAAAEVAG